MLRTELTSIWRALYRMDDGHVHGDSYSLDRGIYIVISSLLGVHDACLWNGQLQYAMFPLW